jgi:hypothetical protein
MSNIHTDRQNELSSDNNSLSLYTKTKENSMDEERLITKPTYKCDTCNNEYTQKYRLKIHKRKHV